MSPKSISRRSFVKYSATGAAAAGLAPFIGGRARAQGKGRVVVLGFDGVEPAIVREMIAQGQLPNLAKLQESGAFKDLGSSIPPQSPVAWTSFATCKNPGGHNIFDFIRRNPSGPRGPMPYVGTGKVEPVELSADGALEKPAQAVSYREGDSFWQVADAQGARCKILNVPFAFPAEELKNGTMLCGLGVTDLRGTTSTFFSFSDAFTPAQLKERLSGGNRVALSFSDDVAMAEVEGPRDQRYGIRDPKAYTKISLKFEVDRAAGVAKIGAGEQAVEITAGQWSDWVELQYPMSDQHKVYAVARFYAHEVGEQVRIYMTCQQFHPEHPYVPFTEPTDYAEELHERYGLYKTIGWAFDTHALRQDELTEDAFLEDIYETMNWRAALTYDELDRGECDLLISCWTATDRVGHMFWRYRDDKHPMHVPGAPDKFVKALEGTYQKMDEIVGNVAKRLGDDDLLMILSDHGFESWRTGFNVNNFLKDAGHLAIANQQMAEFGFLQGFDWANTKAYSIGLSSLYLNLQGRETTGIVKPDEAKNVIAQIKEQLLELKDPDTGKNVFTSIYTRDNFSGEAMKEAPDISFGYNRMYQSAKSAAKGAIAPGKLFEPNNDKWSGEHAAADMAWCPGIFFCNKTVENDKPHIQDLGVTALKYLGKDTPADFQGTDLLG